jgi:aminopeptidase YwaD
VQIGDETFEAFPSPYSNGGAATAPLAVASSMSDLETVEATGRILLLHGEIAREQLMPKNFPFWNPEEHQRIIALLEAKQPAAIIAATARNPELAGAVYPFPLIEDGDFDIPSAYMTEEEGARLAPHAGAQIMLEVRAQRILSTGCNVVASKGPEDGLRIVVCAHIDAKAGTPGALDNATGVTLLLLLAGLLADDPLPVGVELVAINGEDYYASPGEKLIMQLDQDSFDGIALAINIDGAGYRAGKTAYSFYGCPVEIESAARTALSGYQGLVEGESWVQGDHSMFIMGGRPAIAVTSEMFWEILTEIAHTPRDTIDQVDTARLAEAALALRDVIRSVGRIVISDN